MSNLSGIIKSIRNDMRVSCEEFNSFLDRKNLIEEKKFEKSPSAR